MSSEAKGTNVATDVRDDSDGAFAVAALYHFARVIDLDAFQERLAAIAESEGVTGTLIVAGEGINGTIAGTRTALERMVRTIRETDGFADLEVKWSTADANPFIRLKVRRRAEIVTMGEPDLDPATEAGTYISPQDWNALIADPDTIVVDTRNDYEVAIGTFAGAVNPETETFRAFPDWADANLNAEDGRKIAMFCTGGIRCEKATALLKARGFQNVFHLKGGILKYLEEIAPQESLWDGECFVFDRRVSVTNGLGQGTYQLCAGCRDPFRSGEAHGGFASELCPACEASASPEQKARAAERQRQIGLAKARGEAHIGPEAGPRSANGRTLRAKDA